MTFRREGLFDLTGATSGLRRRQRDQSGGWRARCVKPPMTIVFCNELLA